MQIAVGDAIACIDPLTDMDLSRILGSAIRSGAYQHRALLQPGHGSALVHLRHGHPKRLIDTQICAALLGYPAQIGYAGLAAELLNADIAKSQTRTDWSRRPLTDAQTTLRGRGRRTPGMEMHEILKQRLIDLGRYEWALEDSISA